MVILVIIPANNYVTNFDIHFLRCVPPFGAVTPLSPGGRKFHEGINVSYLIAVVIIMKIPVQIFSLRPLRSLR